MNNLNILVFLTLVKQWYYWFNIPYLLIFQDTTAKDFAAKVLSIDSKIYITYNPEYFYSTPFAIVCALHEVGHIVNEYFLNEQICNTKKDKIKSEYKAELFAIRIIKKYYPHIFEEVLTNYRTNLNSRKWRRLYPFHCEALKKLVKVEPF